MAEDFPTKPLDQSVIFNARTDKIDNTSDNTKSNPGNVIGNKIKALQDVDVALTGRVTTSEGKIATLEAAAGLPGGVDLAADVAAVRLTRRYGRPGLAMRTWTSTVTLAPASATPLTVTGAFSIQASANGPTVAITGAGSIGPIVPTYLEEDGSVKTFVFKVFKSKNDADAANNFFIPRFRAFGAAFNYINLVTPANSVLTEASGLQTRTVRLSRDPAKSDLPLPAGTVWVREYVAATGTDGVTNVLSIEQASQAEGATTSLTADAALPYEIYLKDPVNNRFATITRSEFSKLMQGDDVDSNLTPNDLIVDVNQTSSKLIGEDIYRRTVIVQAPNADIAICFGGGIASFDGSTHSYIIYAGSKETYKGMKTGVISMVARAPVAGNIGGNAPTFPARVSVTLGRSIATPYVNPPLGGYDAMSYWPDPADQRLIDQCRTSLAKFQTEGILSKLSLIALLSGATEGNNRINLANPSGPKLIYNKGTTGIITTPYKNTKGGGTDAYINTGLNASSARMTPTSMFMATQIDGTALDANGYTMGLSSNYYVHANRSASAARMRSSTTGDDVLTAQPGAFIALNRNSGDSYSGYAEDAKTVFPVTNAVISSTNLMIMAIGSTNTAGVAAITAQPIRFAIAGEGLNSDASVNTIRTEMAAIMAVCATIRGGV